MLKSLKATTHLNISAILAPLRNDLMLLGLGDSIPKATNTTHNALESFGQNTKRSIDGTANIIAVKMAIRSSVQGVLKCLISNQCSRSTCRNKV